MLCRASENGVDATLKTYHIHMIFTMPFHITSIIAVKASALSSTGKIILHSFFFE